VHTSGAQCTGESEQQRAQWASPVTLSLESRLTHSQTRAVNSGVAQVA
jgi:hypothetical protein